MDVTPSDVPESPDVSEIDLDSLEVGEPAPIQLAGDAHSFHVVMDAPTWQRLIRHTGSRTDVEVGGVLLGSLCRDADNRVYLLINATIPALAAESKAANVTFTAEAWTRIHELIDRDHPGAQIVGWYHTHPNFGIFLSEMDVFIQRHFFDGPHQVAIVVDPVANTHGCFTWQKGTPTEQPLIVPIDKTVHLVDTPAAPASIEKEIPSTRDVVEAHTSATEMPAAPARFDPAQWAAVVGLGLLLMIVLTSIVLLVRTP